MSRFKTNRFKNSFLWPHGKSLLGFLLYVFSLSYYNYYEETSKSRHPTWQLRHPQNKRQRRFPQENAENVKEKIKKFEESIAKLKAHSDKGTCPKTLCYNAWANIFPHKNSNKTLPLSQGPPAELLANNRMANLYSVHHTFLFLDESSVSWLLSSHWPPSWICREFPKAVIGKSFLVLSQLSFSTVLFRHILKEKRCVTTQTKEAKETATAKAANWMS